MNKKLIIAAILAIAATAVGLHRPATTPVANQHGSHPSQERRPAGSKASTSLRDDISVLTQQQRVADYLHQHQQLPPLYLKKVMQGVRDGILHEVTSVKHCRGGPSAAIAFLTAKGACQTGRDGAGLKPTLTTSVAVAVAIVCSIPATG